jgi:hypothetical protein
MSGLDVSLVALSEEMVEQLRLQIWKVLSNDARWQGKECGRRRKEDTKEMRGEKV